MVVGVDILGPWSFEGDVLLVVVISLLLLLLMVNSSCLVMSCARVGGVPTRGVICSSGGFGTGGATSRSVVLVCLLALACGVVLGFWCHGECVCWLIGSS